MHSRTRCFVLALISAFPAALLAAEAADDPTVDAIQETPLTDYDRDHWSFRPLVRPPVPKVSTSTWSSNPIDCFVQAEHEARGLKPSSAADRVTLIRRLCFDLIGLPPTPEEVDRFMSDSAPDAYDQLVDRLLASPRHGEHFGQTWLDLARFAETDGFEHDKIRKSAWQYRDWVIDALNRDVPYDEFIALQLAGDQLHPGDASASRATAFCLAGPDMPDINSQQERRHNLLNEITSTVGAVFLGLQIGCAQCHDHKYDPISQADFYRMRAIFEPAVRVKKNVSVDVLSRSNGPPVPSRLMIRGDWTRPGPVVAPAFPRIADPRRVSQEVNDESAHDRPDAEGNAADSRDAKEAKRPSPRVELARWLASPDHPLTARVMVNRVWQHHFGHGLSRSPSDFGLVGDEPSHPALLDWLAVEFIESGWSLKHLHRLIVTSETYRQASRLTEPLPEPKHAGETNATEHPSNTDRMYEDAANYWLSRFPRRRLSGEAIRDAMYASSESLDLRQGGPGVRPPLPDELVKTLLKNQWQVSPRQADHYRRSIYVFARRNLRYPIFEAFDRPAANASCAVRGRSTTAPQSLLLINSSLSLDAAERLAVLAQQRASVSREQIEFVFRRVFSRRPTKDELQLLSDFFDRQLALANDSSPDSHTVALTDLCLALFNASEFIYVD